MTRRWNRCLGTAVALALAGAGHAGEPAGWLRDEPRAGEPPKIPDLGPPEAQADPGGGVGGRLLVDGRPLSELEVAEAGFWFRHEATNTVPKPQVVYRPADASFRIVGLEPGKHFVQVTMGRHGARGPWGPGDFYGGQYFDPADGTISVAMREVIHMLTPEDNAAGLPNWDSGCDPKPVHAGPVRLTWAPLACCPRPVLYEYAVHRIDCDQRWSYGEFNRVAHGSTLTTGVDLDLPPSGPRDYYLLMLTAQRERAMIGQLQVRGAGGGLGWDYRFRVGSTKSWMH